MVGAVKIATVLLLSLLGGCAGAGRPSASPSVGAAPSSAAPAPNSAVPSQAPTEWLTKLDRDNALVGKVWDVQAKAFVPSSEMGARLATARFVLLGERHDNPDHHRLQGRAIEALVKAGRRPAVVLEMLELQQQPAIDEYLKRSDASAAGFGAALGWEKTSWPPFSEYQPILDAAFAHHLKILGGNLAQADAKALVKQGVSALAEDRARALWLQQAFPSALETSLVDELRASHCGQLPENLLQPMALAQHARDAQMATVLARSSDTQGAVLIAGGGHARKDRGVPYYLGLELPGVRFVSVLFREVRHADPDPEHYVNDEGPFDYLWFTPRASDDDPCAAFAK
jgi:uncharacterized iron-regulated protein